MRTPGEDEELAAGFLAGEGLISGPEDVAAVGLSEDLAANVIEIGTRGGLRRDPAGERRFYLTSSCGVCGKGALEFVRRQTPPQASSALSVTIEPEVVLAAPDRARREQAAFRHTGGLHATALFAADGALLVLREDVGRHNAMDRALGLRLLEGAYPRGEHLRLPQRPGVVRARAEGQPAQPRGIVAVGAPSTLGRRAGA